MKKAELVFIPSPGLSHLVSTVEMAKLLLDRDDRLAITVLIMTLPNDAAVGSYMQKTSSDLNKSPRLRFLNLPGLDDDNESSSQIVGVAHDLIDKQTDHVREAISGIVEHSSAANDSQLAGLVLDIFCTKFIDVAKEFGLPSYLFLTSCASGFGLAQCLVEMRFEQNQDLTQFINSDVELSMPYFTAPVPAKVLPSVVIEKVPIDILGNFKRIREMSGIMVNTFYELESHAIDSLNSHGKIPKVYAVGPILNQSNKSFKDDDDVKKWLDNQPENSVVFLCFGTNGSLDKAQVREISLALENTGFRFLWSLRKPTTKGGQFATEYENLEQVLPEGFLERTKGVGKVIGWAPQVEALSHAAVGGFISHCGWNSTLESVWYGVPIAAFPMYAEQHMNAFELVIELGMAEAITLDYHMDFKGDKPPKIVGWEEIAAALRRLMAAEGGSGVRGKVKEMQSKARAALVEGGSSFNAQKGFIDEVVRNIA